MTILHTPPQPYETRLSQGIRVIKETCKVLPQGPGVYRMLNGQGQPLYIGKAKNLCRRVTSYTQVSKLPLRLQRMVSETVRMEIVTTHTEAEALLLEANLIQKLEPTYNIIFRDNKTMPYLVLTQEKWPALRKHRGKRTQEGDYFGPFPSGRDLILSLVSLTRAFMIRSCTDAFFKGCARRKRPCLQYHIKRCSAPCVNEISPEAYQQARDQVYQVLSGESGSVQQTLAEEMTRLSDAQLYEQAALVRDRIRALTQLQTRQSIFSHSIHDADVIAVSQLGGLVCFQMFFFRNGGNYGTKAFFPPLQSSGDYAIEDLLESFLSQFYQNVPPPPLLLLNMTLSSQAVLEKALSHLASHPVVLRRPSGGDEAKLVAHAEKNAQEALSRTLAAKESHLRILKNFQDFMGLVHLPQRIEVYDNSHLQGNHAYGVMIVAGTEGFIKKAYRKYGIKGPIAPGDDYGMMREVFTRRFRPETSVLDTSPAPEDSLLAPTLPDLIIVDGGLGQLHVAQQVLEGYHLSIPLLGVSKGPQRNAGEETLHRLDHPATHLGRHDPLLYYIQRLRDEAHRFAITTHRAKRVQGIRKSRLEDIPGVGAERKRLLLYHFGSLDAIKRAGIEDLTVVANISKKLAETIYAYFQNHG